MKKIIGETKVSGGSMKKEHYKTAFIKTLPVMAGYLVLGFGFGIVSLSNGYGFPWVLAMSGLIYAGSMQYAAIGLLTGGASLLTVALTTVMVNARHIFYGISMIGRYRGAGKYKPYLIFALTDETYSLTCTGDVPSGADAHAYCFVLSLLNHVYWISGSLLGVLAGSAIPFNTKGIDFAMTALFLTVFVEQWKTAKRHTPAVAGVGISLLSLLVFGADRFLIPAMLVILAVLLLYDRRTVKDGGGAE